MSVNLSVFMLFLIGLSCALELLPSDHDIVTAGRFHTCGIHKRNGIEVGGSVKCWGYNDHGQASPPYGMFTQVSSGHFHSCAISIDGRVQCWGKLTEVPPSQKSHETYDQVCSGEYHSCAIRRHDGKVECWGRNDFGESTPLSSSFIQISCGNGHTCGIKDNGEVACWGRDKHGESSPQRKTHFKHISAGPTHHTCGVTKDNDVQCWGDNRRSQSIDFIRGPFKQVTAGSRSTCAIHEERGLECWGSSPPISPRELANFQKNRQASGETYRQITSGNGHICVVLDADGELHCWSSGADFKAHNVPLGFKSAIR